MNEHPVARVGISGWRYVPWRGDFYPKGLPQRRELEFASRKLDTIELNGTFWLHGETILYESGYNDDALDRWADRVRGWLASGRDSYVYFDNDIKVRAPYDAMALAERLHQPAS